MKIRKEVKFQTETDYEFVQPMCEYSIEYMKGNVGCYSYYYLSCTHGKHHKNKQRGYESFSFTIDFTSTIVPLVCVKRKTAKMQANLDKWLQEQVDRINECFNYGVDGNMLAVYNYVMQNPPSEKTISMFRMDTSKYKSFPFMKPDYVPCTWTWLELDKIKNDVPALHTLVANAIETYGNDYKAMTEIFCCLSWMGDLTHGKESWSEFSRTCYECAEDIRDAFYNRFDTEEAQAYFFEITD